MQAIKRAIRSLIRSTGFDLVRYQKDSFGLDSVADMQRLTRPHPQPVILDVGANVGQTVDLFRTAFPAAVIHSFEPSPTTFARLKSHCESIPGVQVWNYGVGAEVGMLSLQENAIPEMSSFLPPGQDCWGKIVQSTDVPVTTLDRFAQEQSLGKIDILKSDTQGFDLQVLKGAPQLMKENRIGLVFLEVIFDNMYKSLPGFDEIFNYLSRNNFELVSFYKQHYKNQRLSWTDVLFINSTYK